MHLLLEEHCLGLGGVEVGMSKDYKHKIKEKVVMLLREELIFYLMRGNNFHNGGGKNPMSRYEAEKFFQSIDSINEIDIIDEELSYYNEGLPFDVTKEDLIFREGTEIDMDMEIPWRTGAYPYEVVYTKGGDEGYLARVYADTKEEAVELVERTRPDFVKVVSVKECEE